MMLPVAYYSIVLCCALKLCQSSCRSTNDAVVFSYTSTFFILFKPDLCIHIDPKKGLECRDD